MKTIPLLALLFLLCVTASAAESVDGRYVYYGNGLSHIMGIAEVEVWSWGENMVAKRPETVTVHCLTKLTPDGLAAHVRNMVDGNKDTTQRWPSTFEVCAEGMGYKDAALSHCAVEFDLGSETPIERIEFYRSRYIQDELPFKLFGDLGWRYMLVLDAERRIVAWEVFNIYPDDWRKRKGHWTFVPKPATGAPAGRVVPKDSLNWLSEAEYIRDFLGKPVVDLVTKPSAEDLQREAAFKRRNDPEEIERLGRKFFRVVDLDRPALSEVKALVEKERYAEALEAFKAPFFQTISVLKETHGKFEYSWMSDANSRTGMRARDLLNHIYGDKDDLTVKRFEPGLLPPAKFEHPFQMRPLLLAYASTGELSYLRVWESMTDDWAMGFQDAADKDPLKLRDHFVLIGGPVKDNLLDLVNASRDRPEFIQELSGATLARYLLPILEEMPVSIWRVCRTCNFNHTYNAIPGSWTLAQALADFRSGQRLAHEVELGFSRLYTDGLYRDGSMVEVGDEGHYAATIASPGDLYGLWARYGRPAWLNRGLETYFLDAYRANILSHVRNVTPSGVHPRWSTSSDQLGTLKLEYGFIEPWERERFGGQSYCPELCRPLLRTPETRAIVDTVYGQGRPIFEDESKAREQAHLAEFYGGKYEGSPTISSDWMPYTGLWYFRGGWDRDASYLHMVKTGHPNNMGGAGLYPITRQYGGGQFAPTSYRFHDFATPLMTGQALLIDGLPPCPHEGRYPSGSKQEVFSRAIEKPQPSRWLAGDMLDFGEAIYHGAYRILHSEYDHDQQKSFIVESRERIGDVTAWRQIIQVLPARLFLQVDRVRYAEPDKEHAYKLPNVMVLVQPNGWMEPDDKQLFVLPDEKRIVTENPVNGSVTVDFFGQPTLQLAVNPAELAHGSFRPETTITHSGYRRTKGKQVFAEWSDRGETVLISVLRASLAPERPKPKVPTINTDAAMADKPAAGLDDFSLDELEAPNPKAAPPKPEVPEGIVLHATRDLSTTAFAGVEVTTPGGIKATLLIARRPPAALAIADITVTGEAFLLVVEPEKAPSLMLLGATSLSVGGQSVKLASADFAAELPSDLSALSNPAFIHTIRKPIDPPAIGPAVNTFVESATVTLTSETPDVELYYLAGPLDYADSNAPVSGMAGATANVDPAEWKHYTGPFTISESTFVRARAVRPGIELTKLPFTAAGVDASAVSYGFFQKRPLKPAISAKVAAGLNYDYLEDRWFALWTYNDVLPAKTTGATEKLLDVSMRTTDGPFGVRYRGFIDVPASGVYIFHAPKEFVDNTCAPGYDLRVYVDGEEWRPAEVWHGLGAWSVPLAKGLHRFMVTFADARAKDLEHQRIDLWRHYPHAETTWKGVAPVLEISGPGIERQPLPNAWLKH